MKLREKYLNFKFLPRKPERIKEKITALVPSPLIRESMQRKLKRSSVEEKFFEKNVFAKTKYNATH